MADFLLTWNPVSTPMDDDTIEALAQRTLEGGTYATEWSTGGRTTGILPGDTGYLVRQIRERGIVAQGAFTSSIHPGPHWKDPAKTANYADIEFETYLATDERLPLELLLTRVPSVPWNSLYGSGVKVEPAAGRTLRRVWQRHLADLDRDFHPSEELPASDGSYAEGAAKRVMVNRYERDSRARHACIEALGTTCTVCDFDFEARYGPLGKGYVHVHHLVELASIPDGYMIDPATDLIPVCANCHAMLHSRRPALTPQELRQKLR